MLFLLLLSTSSGIDYTKLFINYHIPVLMPSSEELYTDENRIQ